MKAALLILVLLSPALAATLTYGDSASPSFTTITIRDTGLANAPARCIGTASAYVQPQPNKQVMTWVEETGLATKNVSGKDILKLVVRLDLVDVRGNGTEHIWELDRPGATLVAGGIWDIGRGRHWSGPRPSVSQTEYDSTPPVEPQANCRVDSVFFTDGTVWPAGAVWPQSSGDRKNGITTAAHPPGPLVMVVLLSVMALVLFMLLRLSRTV